MKSENFFTTLGNLNQATRQSYVSQLLSNDHVTRRRRSSCGHSDKGSSSSSRIGGKRQRIRNIPMKSSKSAANKKCKPMDYTNYAYNEAVSRLKLMLAESYAPPRGGSGAGSVGGGGSGASGAYMRHGNEDSTDNYSDNLSVIERPIYSDIAKYLSPAQKSRLSPAIRTKPKSYTAFSSPKDNLTLQMPYAGSTTTTAAPLEYYTPSKSQHPTAEGVQAPLEIFNFIEKQEDYIEQLEKESKYCRNELSNLLGKVKDVIKENTHLTETARSELAALNNADKISPTTSPSSDSDEHQQFKKKASTTPRSKKDSTSAVKSPRYASAPNIVYEARISELEAELMQSNIDLKRLKTENEELKRKLAHVDPLVLAGTHTTTPPTSSSATNCETHRKQIDYLQQEKNALEESVRQLQKMLDEAKSQQYQSASSKRYINDLVQMERSQAELEVKHLREELDRQHERVRELQHEMARRIADERANAERRYNTQVDQLGGDLSNQWEQVAKLQLDLEREQRYANDLKRDLSNRNAQIDELKMELRSNRSTFLADMAQVNAEKQSLEQEITSLRLQLDRAAREAKTEATRLTAEITSLRQRLDRGDADLLHSKREILRLNDEIANLEKELAYGELKNEIRPTKKDLDKRMTEMQDKHDETVNELEDMIQTQKQLMDKLTSQCKTLTSRLEDITLKHNQERQHLRETNEKLMDRLKQIWTSYKELHMEHEKLAKRLSLTRPSGRQRFASDTAESAGEEHFSARTYSLDKPLSTTSRPHLVQPKAHVPLLMTTPSPLRTVMTPYSASPARPTLSAATQPPITTATQHPPLPLSIPYTTTPLMTAHPPLAATQTMTTKTNMVSTIPTTKISKTIWEKVRKHALTMTSSVEATMMEQSPVVTQQSPTMTSPKITTKTTAKITPPKTIVKSIPVGTSTPVSLGQTYRATAPTQIWPLPSPAAAMTTTPITAATGDTDNNNTIPALMTCPLTISRPTTVVSNSTTSPNNTTLADRAAIIPAGVKADMVTTQLRTTTSPSTSTTTHPQWLPVEKAQQRHRPAKTSNHHRQPLLAGAAKALAQHQHQHQHHHKHRQQPAVAHQPVQQSRHLPVESPRTLLAAQQRRAEINLERAVALWGQEVPVAADQSAEENPICHNSLPRPPPKSSCAQWMTDGVSPPSELYDPFELEFSISSPSLMRSFGSGSSCTEIGNNGDFDSISEMSISPAQTAIRRITGVSAETEAPRVVEESGENRVAQQLKAEKGQTI